jgi:hypothetical protein
MSFEKDGPFTPPQGGEPERRRDKRRTRRQAGATWNRTLATPRASNPSEPMIHVPGTIFTNPSERMIQVPGTFPTGLRIHQNA